MYYASSAVASIAPARIEKVLALLKRSFPAISPTSLRVLVLDHLKHAQASMDISAAILADHGPKYDIASVNLGLCDDYCCLAPAL